MSPRSLLDHLRSYVRTLASSPEPLDGGRGCFIQVEDPDAIVDLPMLLARGRVDILERPVGIDIYFVVVHMLIIDIRMAKACVCAW